MKQLRTPQQLHYLLVFLVGAVLAGSFSVAFAQIQDPDPWVFPNVFGGGGTWMGGAGEPVVVVGTVGEPLTGLSSNGVVGIKAGFWHLITLPVSTSVPETPPAPRLTTELLQNRPNPFNPTTTVHFTLARQGRVRLELLDVAGRRVRRLLDGELDAGAHQLPVRADGLASGVYLFRMLTDDAVQTRRMVILK